MTTEYPVPQSEHDHQDNFLPPNPVRQAEIAFYREQNFLPLIFERDKALAAVREIVDRGEFTPRDLFVTIAATDATFSHESDNLDERTLDIPTSIPDELYDCSDSMGLDPYSTVEGEEQPFGFYRETEIGYNRQTPDPEDGYERIEEVMFEKRESSADTDFTETIVLERDATGNIKCFRVIQTFEENDEDPSKNNDYEVRTEYELPKNEAKYIIKGLLSYLENAPYGYPYH